MVGQLWPQPSPAPRSPASLAVTRAEEKEAEKEEEEGKKLAEKARQRAKRTGTTARTTARAAAAAAARDEKTRRLSTRELEQKRQVLPHLETIEYIQLHLNKRLAEAQRKPGGRGKRPRTRPPPGAREHDEGKEVGEEPGEGDVWDESLLEQDNADGNAESNQKGEHASANLDVKLFGRYPRFARFLNIQDFGRAKARQRLHWVLVTIEAILDARDRATRRATLRGGKTRMVPFPETAWSYFKQAYGVEGLASTMAWSLLLSLHRILNTWPRHRLLGEHGLQIDLFSQFLRESFDDNAVFVILCLRRNLERQSNVRLSRDSKPSTREHDDLGVMLKPRVCMVDTAVVHEGVLLASLQTCMTDIGADAQSAPQLAQYVFKHVISTWDDERMRKRAIALSEHRTMLATITTTNDSSNNDDGACWPVDGRTEAIDDDEDAEEDDEDKGDAEDNEGAETWLAKAAAEGRPVGGRLREGRWIRINIALRAVAENFAEIPDEIVKAVKFGDDGNRMRMLDQLKQTEDEEKRKLVLLEDLKLAHVNLRSQQARIAKLEHKSKLSEENRTALRTELFLAHNELWRKQQVVNDLEDRVAQVQRGVDETWANIVGPSLTSSTTAQQETQHQGAQMYISFLTRQLQRHGAKVAAVKKLRAIGGWREQLQLRREEAAIQVQRAYRQRRDLRKLEEGARKEADRRRREKRRQRRLQEQLRIKADEEAGKHKTRMQQRAAEEKLEMARIEGRRNRIVAKHREAEAQRRFLRTQELILRRCFGQWVVHRRVGALRTAALRKRSHEALARWREYVLLRKILRTKRIAASTNIQRIARGRQGRARARRLRERQLDHEAKVLLGIRRTLRRHQVRCLGAWAAHTAKMKRARAFVSRSLANKCGRAFQLWVNHVLARRTLKNTSATRIQAAFRGALGRRIAQHVRHEHKASTQIQSCWRAYCCRHIAARARRHRDEQNVKVATYLRRIRWRRSYEAFQAWEGHVRRTKRARQLFEGKKSELLRNRFIQWRLWAERTKKRKVVCACKIQARFRATAAQRVVRRALAQTRMATRIQKVVRGRQCRLRVERLYWEREACVRIQRVWRGRKGRQRFLAELSRFILAHATPENVETVRHAIEVKHIDPRRLADPSTGDTLLHRAVAHGSKRIVKLSLRHGVKPNVKNNEGQTCLHALASKAYPGQDQLADYLMSKGASILVQDNAGYTPLMEAASRGHIGLVNVFTTHADLEARDVEGNTALHLAALHDHWSIVQMLLEKGADRDCRDAAGAHPLHDLAARSMLSMMSHIMGLFDGEGGLDLRDNEGRTPLHYAVIEGKLEAAEMLLNWGATPGVSDNLGRNPLWFASHQGNMPMLKLLLDADCPSQTQNQETGDTALHCACALGGQGSLDVTKVLLKNGANPNVQNLAGDLPVHMACRIDDVQLLHLLLFYDSDMNIKNYAGRTPLGEARMYQRPKVLAYILERFIERDRESQWETEARRKAEALAALLGQVKFTAQFNEGNTNRNVAIVQAHEETQKKSLPEFDFDAWVDLLGTRGQLEVEMGMLTSSAWQRFRILGSPVDRSELETLGYYEARRRDDELSGETFWYNPDSQKFRWVTPPEIYALPEATDHWEQHWDEDAQQVYFYNHSTGQTVQPGAGGRPPPGRGGKYLERKVQKRLRGSAEFAHEPDPLDAAILDPDVAELEGINLNDYQRYWDEENKELREKLLRESAAITIQNAYRRYIAVMRAWRQRVLRDMAIRLQSRWRAFQAQRRVERRKVEWAASIVIQNAWRTYYAVKWFKQERDRLFEERRRLRASQRIQTVWRGYLGRRRARRMHAALVDPAPRTLEDWTAVVELPTTVHLRSWGIFEEYLVRWPDVKCYRNQLTKMCTFEKPAKWEEVDKAKFDDLWNIVQQGFTMTEAKHAIRLQNAYRAKRSRDKLRTLKRGVKIMRAAEEKYLENPFRLETSGTNPEGIVNLCNYMVYLHVIEHKIDKARPLFHSAMNFMAQRGPDNAFVLMSFAIFLAANLEDDSDVIMDYVSRAYTVDPTMRSFHLVEAGFYRQAAIEQAKDSRALLNYALCLQFFGTTTTPRVQVQPDYELAEEYYLSALQIDPHNTIIVENFDFMLRHLKGADYDAYTAFRERQAYLSRLEQGKVGKDSETQKEDVPSAAVRIQQRVRGYLARLRVCRAVRSEWETWQDEASGASFYYSKETGESRWDEPFGLQLVPLREVEKEKQHVLPAHDQVGQDAAAVPWYICEDNHGQVFYAHAETGESVWELPAGFVTLCSERHAAWETVQAEDGSVYYYNHETGEVTYEDRVVRLGNDEVGSHDDDGDSEVEVAEPSQDEGSDSETHGWETLEDEEGNTFYHNAWTGQTTWDLPTEIVPVGAFVYAQYESGEYWYPGRVIRKQHNGAFFSIEYDDGDDEEGVALGSILLREADVFPDGMPCKVLSKGSGDESEGVFFPAAVLCSQGNNKYIVRYEDGVEERGVPSGRIFHLARGDADWSTAQDWEQVQGQGGLCFYRSKALNVAQWEMPLSCQGHFQEPVDFAELFYALDADANGSLNRHEILSGLLSGQVDTTLEAVPALHVLRDERFLDRLFLELGDVDANEFQHVCVRVCREQQLDADLERTFDLLDADGSGQVSHAELKNAMFRAEVLAFVRLTPSLTGLLRPIAFSEMLRRLRVEEVGRFDFALHAKAALQSVEDAALAAKAFVSADLRAQLLLEDLAHSDKRGFVKQAVAALAQRRLRREAGILFRLIDQDQSGVITLNEFREALETREGGDLEAFLRRQPGLARLLDAGEVDAVFAHVLDEDEELNEDSFSRLVVSRGEM
ncbi:Ankyrin repeat domain-containing protein 50 [Hondaea fermentalgiana]|uniref:Ankyrin repeat domain-containing protein 50 n=1 Tax=Hondaea fermentalgiana TaxID=2315210 RepID=A0A2R5GUQ0_9STRA|nr:Ankyrin repeat domain-containing protein 50 [Hondaea fermentalgiana]|eukprot:GBG32111.1 Ankyrin repeat domain-containing protein 50 [Hondaea fermentalgiana]